MTSEFDRESGGGGGGATTNTTDAESLDPSQYVDGTSIRWRAFLSRLARGGFYAMTLAVLGVVTDAIGWLQEQYRAVANIPQSVDAGSVFADPIQTAFDTAIGGLPDGAFGFVAAMLLLFVVLLAVDRAVAFVGA